jgi:hypothetical protein
VVARITQRELDDWRREMVRTGGLDRLVVRRMIDELEHHLADPHAMQKEMQRVVETMPALRAALNGLHRTLGAPDPDAVERRPRPDYRTPRRPSH